MGLFKAEGILSFCSDRQNFSKARFASVRSLFSLPRTHPTHFFLYIFLSFFFRFLAVLIYYVLYFHVILSKCVFFFVFPKNVICRWWEIWKNWNFEFVAFLSTSLWTTKTETWSTFNSGHENQFVLLIKPGEMVCDALKCDCVAAFEEAVDWIKLCTSEMDVRAERAGGRRIRLCRRRYCAAWRAAPYFLFTVRGSFAHRFTAARCGDQFPFSLFFLLPAYTFRLIEVKGDCARGEIKREEENK